MAYILNSRLILNRIKDAYNLKNDAQLARFLDVLATRITNWVSRNSIDYEIIFSKCENINYDWLLTGTGEMLRISDNNIIGDNNNLTRSNTGTMSGGQFVGGNNISVSLPSSGTQKIINADGSVEISSTAPNNQYEVDSSTNNRLKEKIVDMERLIKSLQDTIKAKDETIEILRSQLNK